MIKFLIMMTIFISLVSCKTYEEIPLDKNKILKDVEKQRVYKGPQEGLSYLNAQEIMSENNPDLKMLKQEYEKFKAIAAIKTPFPNPSLEIGQGIGTSLEDKTASSIQPFIGFGFTIPLGPRLARNDDLNEAYQLRSYNNVVLNHRQLSLKLRKVYLEYKLTSSLFLKKNQILKHLKLNYMTVRKMLDLGQATVIDYNSAKIQYENMQISLLVTQGEIEKKKSQLSDLLGKDINEISLVNNDIISENLIPYDELKKKLVQSNFELAQKEMDYKVAEIELKLEISKQYPDLKIGTSGEQEPGEKKKVFSLGISLDLPIFDRNQLNITEKDRQRKVLLSAYSSVLNKAINKLGLLVSEYEIQKKKIKLIENQIIPLAEDTVDKAKKAVQSGGLNVLRYLDLYQDLHEQELKLILSVKRLNEIVSELERLVGESLFELNE